MCRSLLPDHATRGPRSRLIFDVVPAGPPFRSAYLLLVVQLTGNGGNGRPSFPRAWVNQSPDHVANGYVCGIVVILVFHRLAPAGSSLPPAGAIRVSG
jgi:hypothetical protein